MSYMYDAFMAGIEDGSSGMEKQAGALRMERIGRAVHKYLKARKSPPKALVEAGSAATNKMFRRMAKLEELHNARVGRASDNIAEVLGPGWDSVLSRLQRLEEGIPASVAAAPAAVAATPAAAVVPAAAAAGGGGSGALPLLLGLVGLGAVGAHAASRSRKMRSGR